MQNNIPALRPGLARECSQSVTLGQTINTFGIPGLDVLSTPAMIEQMELCCRDLLVEASQDKGKENASVGYKVNITHRKPAKLGDNVIYSCSVEEVKGRFVNFKVLCKSEDGKVVIGDGEHTRAIIPRPTKV